MYVKLVKWVGVKVNAPIKMDAVWHQTEKNARIDTNLCVVVRKVANIRICALLKAQDIRRPNARKRES